MKQCGYSTPVKLYSIFSTITIILSKVKGSKKGRQLITAASEDGKYIGHDDKRDSHIDIDKKGKAQRAHSIRLHSPYSETEYIENILKKYQV